MDNASMDSILKCTGRFSFAPCIAIANCQGTVGNFTTQASILPKSLIYAAGSPEEYHKGLHQKAGEP